MPGLIHLLFLCSGLSGLIYQVVWVRAFGNVFGNTIQSASLVVAVFMLGLGAGSYLVGRWADRRYASRPGSLLGAYGVAELAIAGLGLAISLALPQLGDVAAWLSSYTRDPSTGWWVFSPASWGAMALVAVVLLLPITLLMGGTLTLLIRHFVRARPETEGWSIAALYAVNTAGAAVGCFLTDFWLVPSAGLHRTQLFAVAVNALVGLGALAVSWWARVDPASPRPPAPAAASASPTGTAGRVLLPVTGLAVALSGFAAVGLEIVWFRHVAILLGAFRAVFSLLLTVILVGIGAGSFAAALIERSAWWRARPSRAVRWFIVIQGLLAATTLVCAALVDVASIDDALSRADSVAGGGTMFAELWFNVAPIVLEVGVPALLMGFSFPLANAIVQRAEGAVGRRAGALYLANTAGAVAGSLASGFLLLPVLGLQGSLATLAGVAALAAVPLYVVARLDPSPALPGSALRALGTSLAVAGLALVWWQRLPDEAILTRALPALARNERRLALDEGFTEVIEVTEVAARGRRLLTNGHPMSATWPLSQRYMRALAHLPLLSMEAPGAALVIGFGVGNTTHAVTLHPSIRSVEVADLSRGVLEHADYFAEANGRVLSDPRVRVFINDGRHHLRMRAPATFDLVTLEPPPIGYAGAGALYSREFYELARTRLRPGAFISQWLPVYQVPGASSLSMIRAFVDVFPKAVLVSGAGMDLLLIGTTGSSIGLDPVQLQQRLTDRPAVHADLRRLDLGTVPEIVGTFVGSAATMREGTASVAPMVDDRPVQEYGVRSLFSPDTAGLTAVTDLSRAAEWCPGCYRDGQPTGLAEGLDVYLSLLAVAYGAPAGDFVRIRGLPPGERVVAGSAYLGAVVPESAEARNVLGVAFASRGDMERAVAEFRQALVLSPEFPDTHWHLGAAFMTMGLAPAALEHLRRAVELDPRHGPAHYDLGRLLAQGAPAADALVHLRAAEGLMPESADVHNDLGAVLAQLGRFAEAVAQFERALALRPNDPDVLRNLAIASRK